MTRLIGRGRLLVVSSAVPAITVAPIPLLDSVPLLFAIMRILRRPVAAGHTSTAAPPPGD